MERIPLLQAQINTIAMQLNQRTLENLEYRILMKAIVESHPDKNALSESIKHQRAKLIEQGVIGNVVDGDREYLNDYVDKWLSMCQE